MFISQAQALSQPQPLSQMPAVTQAYIIGPPQVSSHAELSHPLIFYASVMVFVFYFEVPMWSSFPPVGAQLMELAPLQPFETCL